MGTNVSCNKYVWCDHFYHNKCIIFYYCWFYKSYFWTRKPNFSKTNILSMPIFPQKVQINEA